MTSSGLTAFFKSCLFWLVPGLAVGIAAACFLTVQDYHTMAEITGSILDRGSIAEGLKKAGSGDMSVEELADGEAYLARYGYDRLHGLSGRLLPVTGLSVLLFEGIGVLFFALNRKKEKKLDRRISELTDYLRAVNAGEANALTRTEDRFAHLEDELYKTVQKLTCSQESAVHNHEVLSRRIADIAHQLKTPLTSMSLMAELLEEHQTQDSREYLTRLQNQATRLQTLVAGLLALAQLDSHVIEFDMAEFDVAQWIAGTAESIQALLHQKYITLTVHRTDPGTGPVSLTADRHWMGEALLNILKNCAEHTPEHGTVDVAYGQNPLYTEITVTDSGPGFAGADLPHLFERFYRGRGASKDSAGIGLALSRLIIERQNGQIHAENTSDGHARFLIKFYY